MLTALLVKHHHLGVGGDFSADSNLTFPSSPTLATLNSGGLFVADVLARFVFELSVSSSYLSEVRADWTAPAGASAISLISRVVSTSPSLPARVCKRIVVGP